jgi:hypothetical protein
MGLESALVTLGVGAETAASIASVASVVGTAGAIVGGVSSISQGMAAESAAKKQAAALEFQAQEQGAEAARQAQREATAVQQEAESTRRAQKLAYLKSGVGLEGTPLLTMEATRVAGQQNVEEVFRAGGAATGAVTTEGRLKAINTLASGRQAFMSGLTGGAQMFASAFK